MNGLKAYHLIPAGDFEVVPHVRSVIVLDDVISHDLDIDEPWEHVQRDEEGYAHTNKAEGLSYAHAVLSK